MFKKLPEEMQFIFIMSILVFITGIVVSIFPSEGSFSEELLPDASLVPEGFLKIISLQCFGISGYLLWFKYRKYVYWKHHDENEVVYHEKVIDLPEEQLRHTSNVIKIYSLICSIISLAIMLPYALTLPLLHSMSMIVFSIVAPIGCVYQVWFPISKKDNISDEH